MDAKKIRKSFSRFAGRLGINICSWIVKIIPPRYLYVFAEKIAALAYIFAKKHKKTALDSLGIAFGKEKSAQEIIKRVPKQRKNREGDKNERQNWGVERFKKERGILGRLSVKGLDK